MARRPEIGNVQLYPNRPLKRSDKNGYVLKFYCPIQGKRIRKNCGTRDRREARRIQRECRERLLNGLYLESGGAITVAQETATIRFEAHRVLAVKESGPSWEDCFERYYEHRKQRSREKSLADAASRISIAHRILIKRHGKDREYVSEGVGELMTLDSLEYLQSRLLVGDESGFDTRSPMTVNTMMGAVMAFVRYCHKHGWIESVPQLDRLDVDDVMKGRPITGEEFERMLEATPAVVGKRSADSWTHLLRVLWESAFRVGDVMNFSWDDERRIHPVWPRRRGEHATLVIPSSQKNKKLQEIPMLPGLQELLEQTPKRERHGWVVNPLSIDYWIRTTTTWFKPSVKDLRRLVKRYKNSAIARACGVTEAAVRKWLKEAGVRTDKSGHLSSQIDDDLVGKVRIRADQDQAHLARRSEKRLTKIHVGRIVGNIGEAAKIVVRQADEESGRRLKYASAHDIRRGCAQRLINAGVSAETLKLVLRHEDFGTTERYYGATRAAQSAAAEVHDKLAVECKKSELVGGLVGGLHDASELTREERLKLKALLNSL